MAPFCYSNYVNHQLHYFDMNIVIIQFEIERSGQYTIMNILLNIILPVAQLRLGTRFTLVIGFRYAELLNRYSVNYNLMI